MPMYPMKCPKCGATDEVFLHKPVGGTEQPPHECPKCQTHMVREISLPRRDSWPEGGIVLDHIADKPMRFKTKADLKSYCKSKGLSSGALL